MVPDDLVVYGPKKRSQRAFSAAKFWNWKLSNILEYFEKVEIVYSASGQIAVGGRRGSRSGVSRRRKW